MCACMQAMWLGVFNELHVSLGLNYPSTGDRTPHIAHHTLGFWLQPIRLAQTNAMACPSLQPPSPRPAGPYLRLRSWSS
jgi:hypothetical protein